MAAPPAESNVRNPADPAKTLVQVAMRASATCGVAVMVGSDAKAVEKVTV